MDESIWFDAASRGRTEILRDDCAVLCCSCFRRRCSERSLSRHALQKETANALMRERSVSGDSVTFGASPK